MRILVTGGTGFIGSNLALELKRQGHDVIITGALHEQELPEFEGKTLYLGHTGINWDAVGKIDALFHQAAISDTRVVDHAEMMRANIKSSKFVLEEALRRGARHIVYASSTAVYGNAPAPYSEDVAPTPLNVYGESKASLDTFAMLLGKDHPHIRVVGLRYCNVYGPREDHKRKTASMIYQLAQQMQRGNPKIFKWGDQKRDYVYINDAVRANLLALNAPKNGVVNVGSGTATSYNDVINILSDVMGVKRETEYIDNPYEARYQTHTECDLTHVKELLGYEPEYDIKSGISDYHRSGFLLD